MADTEDSGVPGGDMSIIVVGAGIAGVTTALTLRASGFAGRITLLNAEAHEPYDRPPLSKAVLAGADDEASILLDPQSELAGGDIKLVNGTACLSIDRQARTIKLSNGETRAYDRLVIATGSLVRSLENLAPQSPGVHYLRTLDDARRLRTALEPPSRIAIAGAGVIGLEVAASLVGLGHHVSIIDPAGRVMARSASLPLGDYLQRRHEAAGVDVRLNTIIETCDRGGNSFLLTLRDGSRLVADHIVVGVGVVPNSELAIACGIEVEAKGIVVDGCGRTSDPFIYAAGEVTYHYNSLFKCHDRQETWAHAVAHGEHVAHAIMGLGDDYGQHSSYWTDQYDINVQVFGLPVGEQDIIRGDLATGSGIIFHLVEGRVAGVTAINSVRELRAAKKLIGLKIHPEQLSDTGQDLKQFA